MGFNEEYPQGTVPKQPFNRPFSPYEALKYPLPSDMGQIKLANEFLWFALVYLMRQMGGGGLEGQ